MKTKLVILFIAMVNLFHHGISQVSEFDAIGELEIEEIDGYERILLEPVNESFVLMIHEEIKEVSKKNEEIDTLRNWNFKCYDDSLNLIWEKQIVYNREVNSEIASRFHYYSYHEDYYKDNFDDSHWGVNPNTKSAHMIPEMSWLVSGNELTVATYRPADGNINFEIISLTDGKTTKDVSSNIERNFETLKLIKNFEYGVCFYLLHPKNQGRYYNTNKNNDKTHKVDIDLVNRGVHRFVSEDNTLFFLNKKGIPKENLFEFVEFNGVGKKINSFEFSSGENSLREISLIKSKDGEVILGGRYSTGYAGFLTGIYFLKLKNNKIDFLKFYNYADLDSFTRHFEGKAAKKIQEKRISPMPRGGEIVLTQVGFRKFKPFYHENGFVFHGHIYHNKLINAKYVNYFHLNINENGQIVSQNTLPYTSKLVHADVKGYDFKVAKDSKMKDGFFSYNIGTAKESININFNEDVDIMNDDNLKKSAHNFQLPEENSESEYAYAVSYLNHDNVLVYAYKKRMKGRKVKTYFKEPNIIKNHDGLKKIYSIKL